MGFDPLELRKQTGDERILLPIYLFLNKVFIFKI
jgi:hypothetical protein